MTPACRLCSAAATPHHEEAGGRYWRCAGCGFVFLHPAPSPEDLARLYQEEAGATFDHGTGIGLAYEKLLEARLRLRFVGTSLAAAPERTALEIGCGAGYLLESLRRQGWTVAGTEMSEDYVRFSRETLRLDVSRERPLRKFGAVLLFDVLSHVPDPESEFRKCLLNLRPKGVLVVETGNAAEVPPARFGPLGAPEHLWHYSEPTLRGLLQRTGFRDVAVRRLNVEWQRAALRRLAALRPRSVAPSPSSRPPSPPRRPPFKRIAAAHLLLALRFGLGRLRADRNHACTLFVTARAR
jgi:SAM-dependent methyltransferase